MHHGRPARNEPVEFDNATADALIHALNGSAESIDGQSGSRTSYVTTAAQEFRGHFSDLFASNSDKAHNDGRTIADNLRTVATWVQQMKEAAERENARRKKARDWYEEHEDRNFIEWLGDRLHGAPQPPEVHHEAAPTFRPAGGPSTARDTPTPGSGGGGGGGTSSARPADLRAFATGTRSLDQALEGKPAQLRGKLAEFAARCSWGHIDAGGLVNAFDKWLQANSQDATWATTIADAFTAAGGEGNVSTVADSALAAALAAAGVSETRQDLQFEPPSAYGAQPTTGFSMDPVNTSTGNFLEPELDLGFTGASASLEVTRMYNSLDEHVGIFGPGWSSILETRRSPRRRGCDVSSAPTAVRSAFPRSGEGWDRGVGENRWLAAEGDLLVVRDNAGVRIDFTPSGLWTGQRGGVGTAVRVVRDADDLVVRLEHERGRWVEIEHVDGRVAVLRASDGRRVEYGYDDRGRLVSVTDPVGTRATGGTTTTSSSPPSGARTEYRWDAAGLLVERRDADGAVWRYEHTAGGRVASITDPLGARTTFEYAASGELATTVDPLGRRSRGRSTTRGTSPRSPCRVTRSGRSRTTVCRASRPSPTRRARRGGASTTSTAASPRPSTRPASGRRSHGTSQPASRPCVDAFSATTVRFDEFGRPVEQTSDETGSELVTYDAAGRPVELVDGEGGLTRIERDLGGRVTAIVSRPAPARPTSTTPAGARPQRWTPQERGRRSRTTRTPASSPARCHRRGRGDHLRRCRPRGRADHGGIRHEPVPLRPGREARLQPRRTLRSPTVPLRRRGAAGRGSRCPRRHHPLRLRRAGPADRGDGPCRRCHAASVRRSRPRGRGRRPLGRETTARYDAAGRQVEQTDPEGRTTSRTFDAAGRATEVLVDGQLVSETRRDVVDRTVVITDTRAVRVGRSITSSSTTAEGSSSAGAA
ncbi:hypothetical protein Pfo_031636, partial [Paulownia fortunei]